MLKVMSDHIIHFNLHEIDLDMLDPDYSDPTRANSKLTE